MEAKFEHGWLFIASAIIVGCLSGCFSNGGRLGVYWEPIDEIKTSTRTHDKSWPCRLWPMKDCPFATNKEE